VLPTPPFALKSTYVLSLLSPRYFSHLGVQNWISGNAAVTDPELIELIYDDYFVNPATGLNPYIIPRKAGMRNLVRLILLIII
jgi:hypothetical protein